MLNHRPPSPNLTTIYLSPCLHHCCSQLLGHTQGSPTPFDYISGRDESIPSVQSSLANYIPPYLRSLTRYSLPNGLWRKSLQFPSQQSLLRCATPHFRDSRTIPAPSAPSTHCESPSLSSFLYRVVGTAVDSFSGMCFRSASRVNPRCRSPYPRRTLQLS